VDVRIDFMTAKATPYRRKWQALSRIGFPITGRDTLQPLPAPSRFLSSTSWLHGDETPDKKRKSVFRTVWISDLHLGTAGCNAEALLGFLKSIECETLYLVGDIIDGWRLKRSWYWPVSHNDIVRQILKKAKRGTRVVYIPGNHDEGARQFIGLNFGGVQIMADALHKTADGRTLWIVHGDIFDSVVLYARWLAFLGDYAYEILLKLNTQFNAVRRSLGFDYWSLSAFLKKKVKNAVEYIGRFEDAVIHAARDRGVDGVVCGHIHSAEIRPLGDLTYYNDGDWVESCSALVEHQDGRMELIYWSDMQHDDVRALTQLYDTREAIA
jgi:UDP-2,3-diacylglucosamine pyrophosphatase LpxH